MLVLGQLLNLPVPHFAHLQNGRRVTPGDALHVQVPRDPFYPLCVCTPSIACFAPVYTCALQAPATGFASPARAQSGRAGSSCPWGWPRAQRCLVLLGDKAKSNGLPMVGGRLAVYTVVAFRGGNEGPGDLQAGGWPCPSFP